MYQNADDCGKKRSSAESNASSLSEDIKRFRISETFPGDIRIQKEIQDLESLEGIRIQYSDHCTTIAFLNMPLNCPNKFSMIIPRYYPHYPPQVRCLSHGFENMYIQSSGLISHPDVEINWTALDTLTKILNILHSICVSFIPIDNNHDAMEVIR
jgi:ubiquitin-protein ligase